MFDHMQPEAVTLVIMGLDHGIGHIPAEYRSFKGLVAGISGYSSRTYDAGID